MRALYGEQLGTMEGVLHVVAVHEGADARSVIRIGALAPKSATDFFALELARARVEAIVITGAILRAEPELRYALSSELAAYRGELGLTRPPCLVVLTGGDIPLDHPALAGPARPIIFTSSEAAPALRARTAIEIVGVPAPSARRALAHLRDERGHRSISVEAGPTTAVPLYADPCAIDELALSVFTGELDLGARGGRFLDERELERRFDRVSVEVEAEWRFERWLRRG
jgi:riboflavin biosynthesis pyrimidine reductase